MTERRRCLGTTLSGEPCRSAFVGETGYCNAHEPSKAARERHRRISAKGGRNRARIAPAGPSLPPLVDLLPAGRLDTPEALRTFLGATLQRLAELPFSVSVAHAVAAVANTTRTTIELGELANRIAALEAAQQSRAQSRALRRA